VNLEAVPFTTTDGSISSSSASWYDATQSILVDQRPGATMYLVKGLTEPISPSCAAFFGGDPEIEPDTIGFVACGDKSMNQSWVFSQSVMENFGLEPMQTYSEGISSVYTGKEVSLTLYDGDDTYRNSANRVEISKGTSANLMSFEMKTDLRQNWNLRPRSFTLSF